MFYSKMNSYMRVHTVYFQYRQSILQALMVTNTEQLEFCLSPLILISLINPLNHPSIQMRLSRESLTHNEG